MAVKGNPKPYGWKPSKLVSKGCPRYHDCLTCPLPDCDWSVHDKTVEVKK